MSAPRIKFCGITREQDAELAVSLDAWAVGMILWPHSPRAVSIDRAAELAALLKRRTEVVGVFVNPTLEELASVTESVELTIIQLHGQEGPAFCAEAARRTGCRIIKAVRVQTGADIQALAVFHTDFHLLDSYRLGVPGGTGETFGWELAVAHRRIAPPPGKGQAVPLILSGGLSAGNVAEAIARVHPFAVDVASGVESAPGYKDHEQMRAFAQAVAATGGGVDHASAETEGYVSAETEGHAPPEAVDHTRAATAEVPAA
ncbi:MAG: phosphoribosylanthranilate isomerase [Solirubrobacteraceae bacterium]